MMIRMSSCTSLKISCTWSRHPLARVSFRSTRSIVLNQDRLRCCFLDSRSMSWMASPTTIVADFIGIFRSSSPDVSAVHLMTVPGWLTCNSLHISAKLSRESTISKAGSFVNADLMALSRSEAEINTHVGLGIPPVYNLTHCSEFGWSDRGFPALFRNVYSSGRLRDVTLTFYFWDRGQSNELHPISIKLSPIKHIRRYHEHPIY